MRERSNVVISIDCRLISSFALEISICSLAFRYAPPVHRIRSPTSNNLSDNVSNSNMLLEDF
jgi:hypothetical protein